jgi:hypothetical protein
MPFSGNQYTPPAGALTAAPGQIVQSAVWDAIFTDMAAAFTTLMTQANTTPTWSNILAPNGGFAVWQRGAGASATFPITASSTQYTADRWYITTGANQQCGVNTANGLTASAPPAHAVIINRSVGQTGTGPIIFGYPLTADEVARIRGQQVSFSGAAKAGAGWSPTNGTFVVNLYVGTGSAQKAGVAGANFTNLTNPLSISTNLAVGATNLAVTGTSSGLVAPTSTQGEIQVTWSPTGTAIAGDAITLDQFCLVPGTIVQNFEDIPFDISLRECKRFYRKSFPYSVAPVQTGGLPGAVAVESAAASQIGFYVNFEPVEMIATAAFTSFSPQGATANWYDATTSVSVAASFDTLAVSAKGVLLIGASVSAASHLLFVHYTADAGL